MKLEDRIKFNLKKLLDRQELMEFPQFLQGLRNAYGQSRRNVCKDLKFSEMRMYCLENGTFRIPMQKEEIDLIADYYGVESEVMEKKAYNFITQGLGVPQTKKWRR